MLQHFQLGSAKAVVAFCRFARKHGLSSGARETIECLQALSNAPITGVETVKFALRAILCSSKKECDLFDDLFDRFWGLEPNSETHSGNSGRSQLSMDAYNEEKGLGMLAGASAEYERESEGGTMSGASAVERLRRIDLSQMSQADLAELERISQRLLR